MSLFFGKGSVLPCTLHFSMVVSLTSAHVVWVCGTRSGLKLNAALLSIFSPTEPCDLFMSVSTQEMVGGVGYCGGRRKGANLNIIWTSDERRHRHMNDLVVVNEGGDKE